MPAKFGNGGQTCTAANYFYITIEFADEFVVRGTIGHWEFLPRIVAGISGRGPRTDRHRSARTHRSALIVLVHYPGRDLRAGGEAEFGEYVLDVSLGSAG
ncbi:hypothetical protein ABZV91_31190 [Nocardia sp. NPDC004568]|uniref:hypothetical protein n=1 Tax=Nocardia sp. NPDC004568 TaxID=3154551 RepID=UPI0033AA5680